jgi:hypothetical protein
MPQLSRVTDTRRPVAAILLRCVSTDKRLAAQLCQAGHRAPNIGSSHFRSRPKQIGSAHLRVLCASAFIGRHRVRIWC